MKQVGEQKLYDGSFDPYRDFVRNVPVMIDKAREEARENGVSPRGFLVGAAVMAVLRETHEMKIFYAANSKVANKNKVCAEHRALGKVQKNGLNEVVGIVVVGPTDPDDIGSVTDIVTPTLHPCSDCQNRLLGHDYVSDSVPVVTAGLTENIYQTQSVEEIQRHHDGRNHRRVDAPVINLDVATWPRRVAMYDALKLAESHVKHNPRPDQLLAQLALVA